MIILGIIVVVILIVGIFGESIEKAMMTEEELKEYYETGGK